MATETAVKVTDATEVFSALETWIKQRPGLDPRNYGFDLNGRAAYRSELYQIGKDKKRALEALEIARNLSPAKPDLLSDAFRAYSGRLQWTPSEYHSRYDETTKTDIQVCIHSGSLSYCTGQYWPTEYRKAAASVLELYIAGWKQWQASEEPKTFTYKTLADVKSANRQIGNHWFDRSTMRFFNTQIESDLIGGKYFITSKRMELDNAHPKQYSVRCAEPDGTIETIGEFCQYSALADARAAIKALVGK